MLAVTDEEQNTVRNNVEKYSLSVEETTHAQGSGVIFATLKSHLANKEIWEN